MSQSHKHISNLHSGMKYYENFKTSKLKMLQIALIIKVSFSMTDDNDKLDSWFWQVCEHVAWCVWERAHQANQ